MGKYVWKVLFKSRGMLSRSDLIQNGFNPPCFVYITNRKCMKWCLKLSQARAGGFVIKLLFDLTMTLGFPGNAAVSIVCSNKPVKIKVNMVFS